MLGAELGLVLPETGSIHAKEEEKYYSQAASHRHSLLGTKLLCILQFEVVPAREVLISRSSLARSLPPSLPPSLPHHLYSKTSEPSHKTHRSISLRSPPKVATVRKEERTSSAIAPADAYSFCSWLVNAAVSCGGNKHKHSVILLPPPMSTQGCLLPFPAQLLQWP